MSGNIQLIQSIAALHGSCSTGQKIGAVWHAPAWEDSHGNYALTSRGAVMKAIIFGAIKLGQVQFAKYALYARIRIRIALTQMRNVAIRFAIGLIQKMDNLHDITAEDLWTQLSGIDIPGKSDMMWCSSSNGSDVSSS